MINIGLLGLGTVGLGVIEILNKIEDGLEERLGSKLKIKKILVRDKNKKREIKREIITYDFKEILEDREISIIIDATSSLEESYNYIRESLNNGKHVVTANKAVVSKYFEELSILGTKKNCAFLYEASVGGGIPILKTLKEQTATNEIKEIKGILNGTSNYILTRMFYEGFSYDQTLKMAQELGYAEIDPTADVEGYDALRKLRILGTIGLKGKIEENNIMVRGIKNILPFDIEKIKSLNSTIKLLGEIKCNENKYIAMVQPTIIKDDSYFASVNMAFNAISIMGNNVGQLSFYGTGAGKLPTANAMISDVLDIVKNSYRKESSLDTRKLVNINDRVKGQYYLRVSQEEKNTLNKLIEISDKVFSTRETIAITTKEVFLKDILDLIKSLGINEDKYFLARILN
jgi:homoserine dehydrogenase